MPAARKPSIPKRAFMVLDSSCGSLEQMEVNDTEVYSSAEKAIAEAKRTFENDHFCASYVVEIIAKIAPPSKQEVVVTKDVENFD